MAVGWSGCTAWRGCLLLDVLRLCAWRPEAIVFEVCMLVAMVLRKPFGTRVRRAPAAIERMGASVQGAADVDLQGWQGMGVTFAASSRLSAPWQALVVWR